MQNFNISESNPLNTLERCKQTLSEVNKKVEWFLKRGFGEFLHSNFWKQSYKKTQDNRSGYSHMIDSVYYGNTSCGVFKGRIQN